MKNCHHSTKLLIISLCFILSNTYAQWIQTNGPFGVSVQSIAINGTNLFVATEGYLFLSTNNGASWTRVNSGLPISRFINALTFKDNYLFAGTSNGVFVSTNNGNSWVSSNSGLTNTSVSSLGVVGTNLFAGTAGGLFISTNNGTNWNTSNAGLGSAIVYAYASVGSKIYVGSGNGAFSSTDDGASWFPTGLGSVSSLAVVDTNIFAGTDNGVYLSTNNGTSWKLVTISLFAKSLIVSGTNIFASLSDGIYLSTNHGVSWTRINSELTSSFMATNGSDLFASTSGGLYSSTDNGMNWTDLTTNIVGTNVLSYAVVGTSLFAGTSDGAFLSTDNGGNWVRRDSGLTRLTNERINDLIVNGNNIFAATGDGVFLSSDRGTSWTAINSGLPYLYLYMISLAFSGNNLIAGSWPGIFLSTNNGGSWNQLTTAPTNVSSMATSGSNIYAGTYFLGLFLSTNNGASWTQPNSAFIGTTVNALVPSGTNLFAGTDMGAFLSTDNGTSWTGINTGLTKTNILSLITDGAYLFAGTNGGGVFLSSNSGTNWIEIDTSFTTTDVTSLIAKDSFIFAGSSGAGVWKRPLKEVLPTLVFSSKTITFGNVGISDSLNLTLKITNVSSDTITFDSIYTNTTIFNVQPRKGSLIETDTGSLTITFHPTNSGQFYDTLHLKNNSNIPLIKIPLSGNAPFSTITILPTQVSFGNVKKDSTKELLFSITNNSISVLQIDSLYTGTKYFDVVHTLADNIIKKGDTTYASIRFTPSNIGQFVDTLFVVNNSQTSLMKVLLGGNGSLTNVTQLDNQIPTVYTISQNYPNPFNPATTIRFGIPNRSWVKLEIMNTLGQRIATLVNEEREVGYYETRWEPNIASGIYFYRIETIALDNPKNKFAETKKLLLLK